MRILDENHGTGAVTRVLLDSSDGHASWGTIGVSENIIEASWEALVDSLEYAFQPKHAADACLTPDRIPLATTRARRPGGGARARGAAFGPASLGPMLERFEREFADWLGVDDAVAVSSGTTALHLGVRALGWGRATASRPRR